jgi:hypothetical protein
MSAVVVDIVPLPIYATVGSTVKLLPPMGFARMRGYSMTRPLPIKSKLQAQITA